MPDLDHLGLPDFQWPFIDIIYHVSALVICQISITRNEVSDKSQVLTDLSDVNLIYNQCRYMINYHDTTIYRGNVLNARFLDVFY